MKKFGKALLTLALAAGMLVAGSLAVSAADFKGAGTKEDPYLIETAADFAAMIDSVTAGESYTDKYFLQTANLDFTGVTYTVNEINPFDGIYNGQGYLLTNLNITKAYGNDPYQEGNEYMAPFGFVSGVLMNVGVDTSSVNDIHCGAGLARKAKDGAIIVNCYTTADVTATTRGTGLVDYVNSSDVIIANCYYGGTATHNALVGSSWGGDGATLKMCYYAEGKSAGASPIGEHEAIADINSADFVKKLNDNRADAAALAGVDASALVEWTVGTTGATFANAAVKEPETTAAPETTTAPETTAAPETAPVTQPTAQPTTPSTATFDVAVILAVAASVFGAGATVISRKRK